jgi:peptide chain release factor 1
MFHKLDEVEQKYNELSQLLSQPEIIADRASYQKYAKAHADLIEIVEKYQKYKRVTRDIANTRQMQREDNVDEEMRELVEQELGELERKQEALQQDLKILLLPKDPLDDKNILLEIRAGTGGEEAALFAADLFRMYCKYAETQGWRTEIMSSHSTGVGGFKEMILVVEGKLVYSRLKYESGAHRVQRVPITESSGRIHTSAVTVAVLPEAEEVEVQIDPNDLRIDVYRSQGPGGQSVNTTDSAVRITHKPSGLVVTCQDEKSQHKNKAKALRILRARLLDMYQQEQDQQISASRKAQVGSGDRSERIRTYNFPQNRVTDHRINLTLYKLEAILEGQLDELIDALTTHYQSEALKQVA